MLILSLLRLKSVSSHPSPAGGAGAGSLGLLGIKPGGAFSWSLRCSSCRTSSVFSRGNSPGTGVTFTTLRDTKKWPNQFRVTLEEYTSCLYFTFTHLPYDSSSLPCVLLRWCAGGEGRICSGFFPVVRLIFSYRPLLHAVLKY